MSYADVIMKSDSVYNFKNIIFVLQTFTFGFMMMLILMKANNDILNEDVIKIVDIEILAGMPLGTTVKSIVVSFIGVFVLELVTGIFGIWGVIGRK